MSLLDVELRARREQTRPTGEPEVGWRLVTPARRRSWVAALAAGAVAAGIALRFAAPSTAMWLDEAQAVAIARLPVPQLLDALRADGAPPLWYLILHGWMALFGSSTAAVRMLPMLLGTAAVPMVAWVGSMLPGGRRTAAAATVLVATSPFAIRYAAEARMYALVLVLVLGGCGLVLDRRSPLTFRRQLALAAVTGALLLTHYWAVFLVAAAAVALLVGDRPRAWRLVGSMAAGGLLFLPWVPSFLHQLARTGAPWGRPPGAAIVELTIRGFAGRGTAGNLLELVLLLLAGAAAALPFLTGRRRDPRAALLVGVSLATLLLGAVSLGLSGDGFAPRHATVVFGPLMLAVAAVLDDLTPMVGTAVVAAVAMLGLTVAVTGVGHPRTQAPAIAAVLRAHVRRGDVVAACPDQLAPALSRVLEPALRPRYLLPPGSSAERIDWTDYPERVRSADPEAFAAGLDRAAGAGTVWLVSSPNYVGIGRRCTAVQQALARLRPQTEPAVRLDRSVFENAALWRAPYAAMHVHPRQPGSAEGGPEVPHRGRVLRR